VSPSRAPSADLRARVLAETRREPSPTRDKHRRKVFLALSAAAVAALGLFFALGGLRPGPRPPELVAATTGFALLVALVLTRLSGPSPRSMLGRPRAVVVAAVAGALLALVLVALAGAAVWPDIARADAVGRSVHVACGALLLVQGILPLVALFVTSRAADPRSPALTGAALGMAAGAWAATMAYLRCPHAAATHGLAAHVAPTLLLVALGAVVGYRLLRLRR
jgi:hypothetical protein